MRLVRFLIPSLLVLCDTLCAQAPPNVDQERTNRYVESLEDLKKVRAAIRKQCNAIEARDRLLVGQLQSQWMGSVLKYEAALNTPEFTATPILRDICGSNGNLGARLRACDPQSGGIWSRIQDNSFTKNFLAASAISDRLAAQSSLQALLSNRESLLDIANRADINFVALRARADWMGRRSRMEHQAALAIARDAQVNDPRNAGMALIEATSLRSLGEFGDSDDLLNEIDDYFLQLQVIHAMMRAQFDFVNNNLDRAKKTLAEICPIAKKQGWVEPLLVRGWMALAAHDLPNAKRWAYDAKALAPEHLEVAVLIAWTHIEDPSKKSKEGKEAIAILRDAGIRSSKDDWHYLEALANGWARQSDWKQAKQQIEYASETAPSHMQASLQQQLDSIENKKAPQHEWGNRLRSHWKLEM